MARPQGKFVHQGQAPPRGQPTYSSMWPRGMLRAILETGMAAQSPADVPEVPRGLDHPQLPGRLYRKGTAVMQKGNTRQVGQSWHRTTCLLFILLHDHKLFKNPMYVFPHNLTSNCSQARITCKTFYGTKQCAVNNVKYILT